MSIVAIDMGGSFIKFAVVENNKFLNKKSIKTEKYDYELFKSNLIKTINEYDLSNLKGIAISLPGQIISKSKTIITSGSLFCLKDQNIVSDLETYYGVNVEIENDGNCALISEYKSGVGVGYRDLALIVLGTGIGGSIIIDHKLHNSKNQFSGEFGYMVLDKDNNSSWEFLDGSIIKVVKAINKHSPDYESLSSEYIFDNYKNDEVINNYLSKFFSYLAIGIYNIQIMFDPEIIIIGGAISERKDFIPNINEKLEAIYAKRDIGFKINLCAAQSKNDANLIGAYYNYLERVKDYE